MAIVDVEIVGTAEPGIAHRLADAAARVFEAPPATVWVRLRCLDPGCYAENDATEPPRPVFVTVLKRAWSPECAASEHLRLAQALALVLGKPVEHVHITYELAAAGRQSFGGQLVT